MYHPKTKELLIKEFKCLLPYFNSINRNECFTFLRGSICEKMVMDSVLKGSPLLNLDKTLLLLPEDYIEILITVLNCIVQLLWTRNPEVKVK